MRNLSYIYPSIRPSMGEVITPFFDEAPGSGPNVFHHCHATGCPGTEVRING